MLEYLAERWQDIGFRAWQHFSLVAQAMVVAALLGIGLAALATRTKALRGIANGISAVGLTIPSFALLGLLLPLTGIGAMPAILAVAFYATLPILRQAIVAFDSIDDTLIESARGMGMNPWAVFTKVRLPLAWPAVLSSLRLSAQMSMGVAAIAAFVLGPGLGMYLFQGLSQIGSDSALYAALVGTVGVVIVALIFDTLLKLLGHFTISKGIA